MNVLILLVNFLNPRELSSTFKYSKVTIFKPQNVYNFDFEIGC